MLWKENTKGWNNHQPQAKGESQRAALAALKSTLMSCSRTVSRAEDRESLNRKSGRPSEKGELRKTNLPHLLVAGLRYGRSGTQTCGLGSLEMHTSSFNLQVPVDLPESSRSGPTTLLEYRVPRLLQDYTDAPKWGLRLTPASCHNVAPMDTDHSGVQDTTLVHYWPHANLICTTWQGDVLVRHRCSRGCRVLWACPSGKFSGIKWSGAYQATASK